MSRPLQPRLLNRLRPECDRLSDRLGRDAWPVLLRVLFLRLLQSRFPEARAEEWFEEELPEVPWLDEFTWSLARGGAQALTPDSLGEVFESQLVRKQHGAYYTPPELAGQICRRVIDPERPGRILDPACGAGEFLLAALCQGAGSRSFEERCHFVEHHLFGVDLMEEALTVTRLRLQLALAAQASVAEDLALIRALRFNLRVGNSLVGASDAEEEPWHALHHWQATWNDRRGTEGRPLRRPLTAADFAALKPLHWGREFPEVLQDGGFDAVVANPPWEIFKPNAKEFFQQYSSLITQKRMTIEQFTATRTELLKDPEIRDAWLQYLSHYRTLGAYFRGSNQYTHQQVELGGQRFGSDTNLYKLFTERCFRLLRPEGRCGLVLPSGIYTDLGARPLRELLFEQTAITGLTVFENRRRIFMGVHRSYRFAVLTFEKRARTESFPAAFMRHELADLEQDPPRGSIQLQTALIRKLSPQSLSILELKSDHDVAIAEKMLRHPRLGELVKLTSEFHMTSDSDLFLTAPAEGALPLYEGKMVWQFEAAYAPPRYWVDEQRGRKVLLRREKDHAQPFAYEQPRLGIRAVASGTNERSLIATILPKRVFCGNSLLTNRSLLGTREALYLVAVLNSFVVDAFLRNAVTSNVNLFYLYQLPIPHPDGAATPELLGRVEELLRTTDARRRLELRAELDAEVARLYGLTEEELRYVLGRFPLVAAEVKEATERAFSLRRSGENARPFLTDPIHLSTARQ